MNRVLLGVRGAETEEQMRVIAEALARLEGVAKVEVPQPGQVLVWTSSGRSARRASSPGCSDVVS